MGNFMTINGGKFAPLPEVEKSSFDVEENLKGTGGLPEFWPVGGKIFGKFRRETSREMTVYSYKGPVVSMYYTGKSAIISRMYVDFRESK